MVRKYIRVLLLVLGGMTDHEELLIMSASAKFQCKSGAANSIVS